MSSLNILDGGPGPFSVQKFGSNPDIDQGNTPQDIWDVGGLYPFPQFPAAATIVSDSGDDTSSGSGARTVEVQGLDGNGDFISEVVSLDGIVPVNLTKIYFRIFRARVILVGSGGVNAGNITISILATPVARISVGNGQTLMAVFTTAVNWPSVYIRRWYCCAGRQAATTVNVQLITRKIGESFQVKSQLEANTQGSTTFFSVNSIPTLIDPFTDIVIRCTEVTTNNTRVDAGFDIGQ